MTSSDPKPDTINRLIDGTVLSFAMLAGMQLDIFSPLKDGPMTAVEIAGALGIPPDKLKRLLYAIVAARLMSIDGDAFCNTPEAQKYLVKSSPDFMGDRHLSLANQWSELSLIAESIRTGVPQSRTDYSGASEEELEKGYERMHPLTTRAGADLVRRYDFSHFSRLADFGGGSGSLSIAITDALPHLKATVVDLPSVTPVTQRYISRMDASERVKVQSVNIVTDVSQGTFDVAVLRWFIQVLTADQAGRAIKNVGQVMEPGGKVFIWSGAVLDDSLISPVSSLNFDLTAISRFDEVGAYTEQQYRDWLSAAGFEGLNREILPDTQSIITAQKAG